MLDEGTIERLAEAVTARLGRHAMDGVVTLKEAREALRIAPSTLRKWRQEGALPPEYRMGNRRVFKRSEFAVFLATLPKA